MIETIKDIQESLSGSGIGRRYQSFVLSDFSKVGNEYSRLINEEGYLSVAYRSVSCEYVKGEVLASDFVMTIAKALCLVGEDVQAFKLADLDADLQREETPDYLFADYVAITGFVSDAKKENPLPKYNAFKLEAYLLDRMDNGKMTYIHGVVDIEKVNGWWSDYLTYRIQNDSRVLTESMLVSKTK